MPHDAANQKNQTEHTVMNEAKKAELIKKYDTLAQNELLNAIRSGDEMTAVCPEMIPDWDERRALLKETLDRLFPIETLTRVG
jgi:hypothetical protein